MFATLVRRLAQSGKEPLAKQVPLTAATNPYKARRVWPPDFKDLTPLQRFRYERKYKRRVSIVTSRPRWEKPVKYAQLVSISVALIWLFFFGEMHSNGEKIKPVEKVHDYAMQIMGVLGPEKRYERREDAPEIEKDSTKSPSYESK
ncbi:hypothetical protein HIM_00121 [Hirsutella minnesotensis 3608]|nr:hypothetical protein HIM_00121 [Hirsutella minnesotensis 3608]